MATDLRKLREQKHTEKENVPKIWSRFSLAYRELLLRKEG
jgi:hypothetical protein